MPKDYSNLNIFATSQLISEFKKWLFYCLKIFILINTRKHLLGSKFIRTQGEGEENQGPDTPKDDVDNKPGAWEEDFNSFHDSKPYGPEAIALDFTFPQASVLFGKFLLLLSLRMQH